jgi:hypothetical protein
MRKLVGAICGYDAAPARNEAGKAAATRNSAKVKREVGFKTDTFSFDVLAFNKQARPCVTPATGVLAINCRGKRRVIPRPTMEPQLPRYLTIGYGDELGYERTPPEIRDEAHVQDAKLRESGAIIGIAGSPVQVRNPGGQGVKTSTGPFMRSDLPIAGFALIEAANLDEAILQASKTPCAVAYGVVEVWPLE